jgi:hypothetical protein
MVAGVLHTVIDTLVSTPIRKPLLRSFIAVFRVIKVDSAMQVFWSTQNNFLAQQSSAILKDSSQLGTNPSQFFVAEASFLRQLCLQLKLP